MWLYILLIDASVQIVETKVELSTHLFVFMILVVPGMFVAVGSYLQTVHRKPWAVGLVLIGSVAALMFVGINAYIAFGYSGNKWGLRAVFTDLVAVASTLGVALINVFVSTASESGR
jgi:ABC-type Fe3+ transport system permease subunit